MKSDNTNVSKKKAAPAKKTRAKRSDAGTSSSAQITNGSRERILVAAATKFAHHGYDAVSTADIAHSVGLSQAIIHYHFGKKEDLWRESIEHMMRGIDQRFPILSSDLLDLDPISRAKVIIRRFIALSAETPDLSRIVVHEALAESPRLRWLVDRFIGQRLLSLEKAIMQSRGGEANSLPNFVITNAIINGSALMFSLGPLIRLVWQEDVTKPERVADIADALIQFFFSGLTGTMPPRSA